MSLASFAVRMIATRVLAGYTWAGSRVINAPIDPLTDLLTEEEAEPKPLIAVYTNDEMADVRGRETQGVEKTMDLIMMVYLPPSRVVTDEGIEFEVRNSGAGALLDMMARQIEMAFRFGDPVWQRLYDRFVVKIESIRARPILIEVEDALKIPAREIIWRVCTLPDPEFGRPLFGAWEQLYNAMTQDAEASGLADMIKSLIDQPDALPSWEFARARLGLSVAAIRASGLAPQDATETGEAHLLVDVDNVGTMIVTPPEGEPRPA